MTTESPQPYRVLARKYRPRSFSELIGQDAMVQTLSNAITRDRLAHAFLLTGVRGVGKTSTARLIAKALNCVGPDGKGGPTIDPCGVCEPCVAIAEGRHIDVVEMDAASHTGVDDVREIIEAVRYASVSARYKVYIIDEVHMLSRNAFNALLKTLEEPPQHVKFLFATTEINKVPVTVLSRCQRFDLRRISADRLASHFAEICGKEGVEVESDALTLIARAAEGSVRDGLSILDQAIAHGASGVSADQVRAMLGLSDRGAIRALLGQLLAGDALAVLATVKEQYDLGIDPAGLIRGLLECVHNITRTKLAGEAGPAQSPEEREAYARWAGSLSHGAIHRLWQLLLKGLGEVHNAAMPLEAAEMALLRVIYASELPDPGTLAQQLENKGGGSNNSGGTSDIGGDPAPAKPALNGNGHGGNGHGAGQGQISAPDQGNAESQDQASDSVTSSELPVSFAALVDFLATNGKPRLAQQLHDFAALIHYQPPELVIRLVKTLPSEFARDLGAAISALTGVRWHVRLSNDATDTIIAPPLIEQERAKTDAERERVLETPVVKAALAAFPDAELASYDLNESGNV